MTSSSEHTRPRLTGSPDPAGGGAEATLEQRVQESHQRQEFSEALVILRDAINRGQAQSSAWLWLSRTHLALGELSAAQSAALTHLREDPHSPAGKLQLATVLYRRGQRTASIELLNEMLPRYRRNIELVRAITELLLEMEAYGEANAAAELLLRVRPGDTTALRAKAAFAERRSLLAEDVDSGPKQRAPILAMDLLLGRQDDVHFGDYPAI